jgi:hypothetical protein
LTLVAEKDPGVLPDEETGRPSPVAPRPRLRWRRTRTDERRVTVASWTGALLGGLVYLLVLLDFGTDLGRTAKSIRYASSFFDIQAQALMDGHLAVPPGSLGIEGFVVHGHTYMYFGPFPALLRIPVLLVTNDFVAKETLLSMLLAFVVYAAMASRLLWLVRRCIVGDVPVTRLDATLGAVLLVLVTGGTSLTFDASLPWAYHEVYLWQTAWIVTGVYWMVRLALEPTSQAVGWVAVAASGAVLTRTTGGWGLCLGIVALALWMRFGRSFAGERRRWWAWLLAAGLVPLAIGIAVNMAKFGHPYMFPLQHQVWTEVNAHRREALQTNGGTITGPQFFVTSLVNYFSPGGIRFVDYFPWITFPAENARGYGGAFLDQSYRTGSVTAFMPLALLLSLVSLPVLLRPTRRLHQGLGIRALRAPALATFLMTGGVMGYGYIAFRYTSEFVPALVLGSMITLWAFLAAWAGRSRVMATLVLTLLVAGTAWSLVAQTAVSTATAATTYRGAPLERYLRLQDELSGGVGTAFAGLISHSSGLPTGGADADRIHIRGDCEGLYVNTGDANEAWLPVEERSRVLTLTFPRRGSKGEVRLFEVDGNAPRAVVLETTRDGRGRLRIDNEDGSWFGQYFRPTRGEVVRVGLRTVSDLGYVEVTSTPGGFVGYLPITEFRPTWVSGINPVDPLVDAPTTDPATGVRIAPGQGLPLPLCEQIARHNGIDLR